MNIVETQKKKGAGKGILLTAFLWFAVYAGSLAFSVYLNEAPPEIKELGAYAIDAILSRTGSGVSADTVAFTGTSTVPELTVLTSPSLPIRVAIPKIAVNDPVSNPISTDPAVLDNALLGGVVHYPGSGTLEDSENIFLFGHSSYLPVVHNQAFRAFNRLGELQIGDEVQLFSDTREYTYKVTKVELVSASEELINFKEGRKKVILSTCDSFGKKTDRFVVEATFAESHLL